MKLAVIGLGKLGLPLATCLSNHYKVIGIDKYYWKPNTDETDLDNAIKNSKYKMKFYSNYKYINSCDIAFVIVPTPSLDNGAFTNQFIEEVLLELKTIEYRGLVSIVSTVMPNSTHALTRRYNLNIVYNPTFIALGSVINDLCCPSFILIGADSENQIEPLKRVYRKLCGKQVKFAVMKPLEAEICKLALNCFLTTKISFANNIGNLCDILNVDANVIMDTIGMDKRVNPAYLKPGLGFGGPCFPRDNLAFNRFSQMNGIYPALSKAVQFINVNQPTHMINKIKKLGIKKISIPSVSYKPNTDNCECSQLAIIKEELVKNGIKIVHGCKWELNHGGLKCKSVR